MTTVSGMFAAGDASGASSHKFSSGSHAEGRIAAKAAIAYIVDNANGAAKVDQAQVDALKEEILKPLDDVRAAQGRHDRSGHQPQLHPPQAVHVSPAEDHGRVRGRRLQPVQDQRQAAREGHGAAGLPQGRLRASWRRRTCTS